MLDPIKNWCEKSTLVFLVKIHLVVTLSNNFQGLIRVNISRHALQTHLGVYNRQYGLDTFIAN